MAVTPKQTVFNLLAKCKDKWTKQDKDSYELACLLLSVDDQERITIWEGETPDIYEVKK